MRIAGTDVVRGDLIVLAEGDRVPADARLLQAVDLSADESLLTGEAVPVRKAVGAAGFAARPGGEDQSLVFSGTLIVRGTALAEVTATAPRSEIRKIGTSLDQLETGTPHLQRQMRTLVLAFALIGAAVALLVVGFYGRLRGDWLDGVLAGVAVGMAMLPEEFPMVLAVFMAMGAWRISKAPVLPRVLALVIRLPVLGFIADMAGLFGGGLMAWINHGCPDSRCHRLAPHPDPLGRHVSGRRTVFLAHRAGKYRGTDARTPRH